MPNSSFQGSDKPAYTLDTNIQVGRTNTDSDTNRKFSNLSIPSFSK